MLTNFGLLADSLPNDLFREIKIESANLDQNEKTYSGLSGTGVPEHFYLKNELQGSLNDFIFYLKDKYFSIYPEYLKNFRYLSSNTYFVPDRSWFNRQKKHEFVPNHVHDGVLSYTTWINIPEIFNQEQTNSYAGCFEVCYSSIIGNTLFHQIRLDKTCEGKILMFPSSMTHCVYPFYSSEEYRISLSGNILFNVSY